MAAPISCVEGLQEALDALQSQITALQAELPDCCPVGLQLNGTILELLLNEGDPLTQDLSGIIPPQTTIANNGDGTYTVTPGDGSTPFDIVTPVNAAGLPYDNAGSGLTATDTQGAIDELAANTHPEATVTNNPAPFSWDIVNQVGNIPQSGSYVDNGDGSFTLTPGDGSAPLTIDVCATIAANCPGVSDVTYDPATGDWTIAYDDGSTQTRNTVVENFLQSANWDDVNNQLSFTLVDGTIVGPLDLSDLIPVATDGTTITGDGTGLNPLVGFGLVDNIDGTATVTPPGGTAPAFDVLTKCCTSPIGSIAATDGDNDGTFDIASAGTEGDGTAFDAADKGRVVIDGPLGQILDTGYVANGTAWTAAPYGSGVVGGAGTFDMAQYLADNGLAQACVTVTYTPCNDAGVQGAPVTTQMCRDESLSANLVITDPLAPLQPDVMIGFSCQPATNYAWTITNTVTGDVYTLSGAPGADASGEAIVTSGTYESPLIDWMATGGDAFYTVVVEVTDSCGNTTMASDAVNISTSTITTTLAIPDPTGPLAPSTTLTGACTAVADYAWSIKRSDTAATIATFNGAPGVSAAGETVVLSGNYDNLIIDWAAVNALAGEDIRLVAEIEVVATGDCGLTDTSGDVDASIAEIRQQFDFTGADQITTVLAGATEAQIKAWGAAGGSRSIFTPIGGGTGGYSEDTLTVGTHINLGDNIIIVVGEGGDMSVNISGTPNGASPATYGGGGERPTPTADQEEGGAGGGLSGAFLTSYTQANALVVAGGGGGYGDSGPNRETRAGNGNDPANAGGHLPLQGESGDGGGGGGYVGGSASANRIDIYTANGAGISIAGEGGTGFVTTGAGVILFTPESPSPAAELPPNTADADYMATIGEVGGGGVGSYSGFGNGVLGGNGLVVIYWRK